MGDFDRNEKPSEESQSKKVMMVGVLGAVLLGVIVMQMVKRGPSPASASNNIGQPEVASVPGADESPELLRATLLVDPTKTLLGGERTPTTAARLRNPFGMSTTWRKSITREVITTVTPQPPTTRPEEVVPQPIPQAIAPLALKATEYKLHMILNQNGNQTALINGVILSKGQYIKDALVVDVRPNAVVLRHKDSIDGPRLELLLHPN